MTSGASAAAATLSHVTTTSAHDVLQVRLCSQHGCENERRYDRGVAAGLCEEHGRPVLVEHGQRTGAKRGRALELPIGSIVEVAVPVVGLARAYDRAARRARDAERARAEARAELTAGIKRLIERVAQTA